MSCIRNKKKTKSSPAERYFGGYLDHTSTKTIHHRLAARLARSSLTRTAITDVHRGVNEYAPNGGARGGVISGLPKPNVSLDHAHG